MGRRVLSSATNCNIAVLDIENALESIVESSAEGNYLGDIWPRNAETGVGRRLLTWTIKVSLQI